MLATGDTAVKMMLVRRRLVPLVPRKKGRFEEETSGDLRSPLPGLNLGENERRCHEQHQKFRDFLYVREVPEGCGHARLPYSSD